MNSFEKHLRVYWMYFKQFWKTRLIYKTDFVLNSFSQMLNLATSLAFLTLIFTQVESFNGWSFNEMLFLAGVGGVAMNLHHVFMLNIYNLGEDYVVKGKLDRFMVRPMNVLFQVYADKVRDENVPKLMTNFALIVYAANAMGLELLRPAFVLYAVPALFSAVLGFASVYLWISSLAFWTGKNRPLVWIVFRISDFRRYPFTIYSTAIRAVLITLVPLAFASFFPATFFLGRDSWTAFQILSLVAGPVAFLLAYKFWEFGLSNYSSTGS